MRCENSKILLDFVVLTKRLKESRFQDLFILNQLHKSFVRQLAEVFHLAVLKVFLQKLFIKFTLIKIER